mmetsp:Transcript_9445/g.15172  ORF Transcript_9445/g.15172 Transcript_9445/m.15172 type:complete len:464 (-) Transcript_9445:98-1489(-)
MEILGRTITCLVLLSQVIYSTFTAVSADLFVILFEGSQILASFREFSLFHTFSNIPVDKGTLGIHEIKLVIDAGKSFCNGSGVCNHANSTFDSGKVASWNVHWRLVVDSALESGGTPIDELNGTLGLDGCNSGIDILGDNVSTVHETARHVLSVTRVALGHHVGRLEDSASDFCNRKGFMESLISTNDRSVRSQHEVNTRVRNQVGLELGDINVQGTVKTKGGGKRRNDLGNQAVQVGVGGFLDVKVTAADIVESLVVKTEGTVGVFQKSMGGKDRVVRFNDGSRNLRTGRDRKGELGLASVVYGKAFQEKRTKTGTSTSSSCMEDKETLESSTVVGELADTVQNKVDNLLSDGVVATGIVVGGVLLSRDDLLGMVELGVLSSADFVTDSGFQIHEDGTRDVLSRRSLAKEGVERVVGATNTGITWHVTIGGDAVLEAVQLPAVVTDLNTGLSKMNRDTFTHG